MKKFIIASLILGATAMVAEAQTEFRHITFDEALTAAKAEKKLVFIDFFTTWCGPCKKMSSQVFPQQTVGEYMNATFVPLKLDAEKEGRELAQKYEVKSYPTYVIVDGEGKKVTSFSGAMDGDKFVDKLQSQLDPNQSPERVRERYLAGERTPKLVNSYAMQFMEKRMEKEGFEVIDSYWDSLSDADRLKQENAFLFTTYTINAEGPRFEFMKSRLNDFDEADRCAVKNQLSRILGGEFSKYFAGYYWKEGRWDPTTFKALKADIDSLGLNEDKHYDLMGEFVEKRPVVDDATYLAFCEDNYEKLGTQEKNLLIFNLTRLFDTENKEMREGISKFIRARLATMPAVTIQYAARTLDSVEK